jgi:hypothetical protein
MTCGYIQALIKALPIEELELEDYRRVNRHTVECSACRSTLLEANALDSALRLLPDAEPAAGLEERIMVRTAQVEESSAVEEKMRSRVGRKNAFGWSVMFGGAAISFGTLLYAFSSGKLSDNWNLPEPVRWNGILQMPDPNAVTLMLAVGLCLCVAGFLTALQKEEN